LLELRPYQTEAIERIVARRSLLLALTMGAGKTVTAVAAIRQLRRQRVVSHGLIFALKSTKWQWLREIQKVDPRAKVQVVDGTKKERTLAFRRSSRYHYTICHYECLVNDWEEIKRWAPLDFMILDEITAIKGFAAKRSKRAKAIGRAVPVRIGLSGQPLENRPEELFSIYEFIDPEVLGGFHKFDRTFIVRDHWGKPKSYKNLPLIQQRLGDSMYRKSREDISEWLPEMIEMEMPVKLDAACMSLHDLIKADLSEAIDKALASGVRGGFDVLAHYGRTQSGSNISLMGQVMSRLLAMRMLSSHPGLLRCSADDFDTELSRRGSEYASTLRASGALDKLPPEHIKLEMLLDTVTEILDEDPRHKVVVFSYFKPMLRMIAAECFAKIKHGPLGAGLTMITGDVAGIERDKRIVRFNTDPTCRIFLSSDAGAYGVDLNQGSHLICYDLPWSAGALAQRISRIDRTNSAFDQINIGYMYGLNTIEERMFRMLQQKRKVAKAFLDGEFDAKSGRITLDLQSLREFLDS
jgi:SNF2 family DNA or RNA helicase